MNRWSLRFFWFALFTGLVAGVGVSAQHVPLLTLVEPQQGRITKAEPVAEFQFTSNSATGFTVIVTSGDDSFIPVLRVVDLFAQEVAAHSNPDKAGTLELSFAVPEPGPYRIEVRGKDGSTGDFVVDLLLGPVRPGAIRLRAGDTVSDTLSADQPEVVYEIFSVNEHPLLVLVRGDGEVVPDVILRNEIIDKVLGSATLLQSVAFVLAPGDSTYSLTLRYADTADDEPFSVCLALLAHSTDCAFTADTNSEES